VFLNIILLFSSKPTYIYKKCKNGASKTRKIILKLVCSCPVVVHDLRILNPSDTHNNFWYYYVFSVYHSPYNHRSTFFEFL
jgi:hypothetical protein